MTLKPGLSRSPLAVDFPDMPAIAGVEMATGRAGFYAHVPKPLEPEILVTAVAELAGTLREPVREADKRS